MGLFRRKSSSVSESEPEISAVELQINRAAALLIGAFLAGRQFELIRAQCDVKNTLDQGHDPDSPTVSFVIGEVTGRSQEIQALGDFVSTLMTQQEHSERPAA